MRKKTTGPGGGTSGQARGIMDGRILIYGANGYTGRLAVRVAKERGLSPVLAGRNAAQIKAIADVHMFDWRAFGLDTPAEIDKHLADIDVVLHMAGPYSATSAPMVEACLRTGTHYLDITGEIAVFEALAARAPDAKRAGIMLLPGAGFDVVPSDCLLAHMKERLPTARTLYLGIDGVTTPSKGTAKTALESVGAGTLIRRDGRIETLPKPPRRLIDFGDGPVECIGVSWGDIATGFISTGAPNIQVYFAATPELERVARLSPMMRWLLSTGLVQGYLRKQIDKKIEGPTKEQRQTGRARLTVTGVDRAGTEMTSRLETPEPYALTARLCVDIAARVADGAARPGFETPATFLGPDYILQANGVTRVDL